MMRCMFVVACIIFHLVDCTRLRRDSYKAFESWKYPVGNTPPGRYNGFTSPNNYPAPPHQKDPQAHSLSFMGGSSRSSLTHIRVGNVSWSIQSGFPTRQFSYGQHVGVTGGEKVKSDTFVHRASDTFISKRNKNKKNKNMPWNAEQNRRFLEAKTDVDISKKGFNKQGQFNKATPDNKFLKTNQAQENKDRSSDGNMYGTKKLESLGSFLPSRRRKNLKHLINDVVVPSPNLNVKSVEPRYNPVNKIKATHTYTPSSYFSTTRVQKGTPLSETWFTNGRKINPFMSSNV